MLELVALGEPLPVDVVAELAAPDVPAEVEARRLVVVDHQRSNPDGMAVRLTHPLYAEVLRSELSVFAARRRHRALGDAGVAAGLDRRQPLRVATWLLEAGEDVGHAALLVRASNYAVMTDDYETAARLAQAAIAAGAGWAATRRRAEALGPLRRWDEVDALLAELSADASVPEARAAAARVRAAAIGWLSSCEGAVTPLLAGLDGEPLAAFLTEREHEVAGLAALGRTSREIADALTISLRTVESHLHHAYTKLGISDRADLAKALGVSGHG